MDAVDNRPEKPSAQAKTPSERKRARRRRRSSSPGNAVELVERLAERLAEQLRGRVVVDVRAALRLRDDRVDYAELEAVAASGLNAAAAFFASPASRQRIEAQPSGEMTE